MPPAVHARVVRERESAGDAARRRARLRREWRLGAPLLPLPVLPSPLLLLLPLLPLLPPPLPASKEEAYSFPFLESALRVFSWIT
mmetsp:Transcript_34216/g.110300  ORF Transcript_34216/g.110300 Transcript_34216/m.110300 type:complete len:85 (-) Transcript_34216:299-553(-)